MSEIYIPLSTERILTEERKKFPGWEFNYLIMLRSAADSKAEHRLSMDADLAICPSKWVRDDPVQNFGLPANAQRLYPTV